MHYKWKTANFQICYWRLAVFFLLKSLYYQIAFVSLLHENPPSLSMMPKCAGRFCFYRYMATRTSFIKTYSIPHELVQLLKTRGMEITDEEKAVHYLSHIGYYRLSAYMYPLLSIPKEQHLFKQGVTFGKVMRLYRFDKKLRLLLFNEIEKIEVAVRCAIVNFGTEMTGNPFWMTDANNFSNPPKFNRSIRLIEDELNHTKEDFINHFKETYTNQYPPSWMLAEILPFGVISIRATMPVRMSRPWIKRHMELLQTTSHHPHFLWFQCDRRLNLRFLKQLS